MRFSMHGSLLLFRCVEAIFPVRRFLRGKSVKSPRFFNCYQMRYALTLGNSGVFFEAEKCRCCFLGENRVFWADFLPIGISGLGSQS
jgi:hypothetical protein